MKKILITGAGSYIGTSLERHLAQWPEAYRVESLDMQDKSWRNTSFSGFDAVVHVAGIAHIRETEQNAHLYYSVNRDLAVETAQKAKADGVPQFIFLSSMSVYGIDQGPVDPQTLPNPKTHYGKSKYQAEEGITALREDCFAVAVLRPPMVYGEGCKGNYHLLEKIAGLVPCFPDYENVRSMLSIENLVEYIRGLIDSRADGLFCPQDPEYVCTCRMVRQIGSQKGKKVALLKILNPLVPVAMTLVPAAKKAFSDLYYTRTPQSSEREVFE